MYYIVKHGETLSTIADESSMSLAQAKERAQALHDSFGDHWHIIKVETVWTTKTLDEAVKEG